MLGIGSLRRQHITFAEVEVQRARQAQDLAVKPADVAISYAGHRIAIVEEIGFVAPDCRAREVRRTARPAIGARCRSGRDRRVGNARRVVADNIDPPSVANGPIGNIGRVILISNNAARLNRDCPDCCREKSVAVG